MNIKQMIQLVDYQTKGRHSLHFRYFSTKLEQKIFLEEDPNSNCIDYKESTYEDCDNNYIQKVLQQNYPHGFMPVWATENISDVTTYLATNSTDFHDPYAEILTGTEESGTK